MPNNPTFVPQDPRIKALKMQLASLHNEMRENMEQEYAEASRTIQETIDDIAYSYYENGASVAAVSQRLGVKNWRIGREALNRVEKRRNVLKTGTVSEMMQAWTVETLGDHPSGRTAYRVQTKDYWTGGAHTATLNVWDGEPWFDDTDTTTPLHAELRDNWATSPIAAHIKELEAQQR